MFRLFAAAERGTRFSVSEGTFSAVTKAGDTVTVPFRELDAVIVEEPAVSLTGTFLAEASAQRIPVILCDRFHLPASVLQPVFRTGGEHAAMLKMQFNAGKAWTKQIWKKLIQAKIHGQSANLEQRTGVSRIRALASAVKSGDSGNMEARAAALYWSGLDLFPVRDRHAEDRNCFFNYAYTILYAAFARAVCAASLAPEIGIRHHGKYNAFCLASDLMEPFRPLTDQCVFSLIDCFPEAMTLQPEIKHELLKLIYSYKLSMNQQKMSLPDAVPVMVHSFKQCLRDGNTCITLPEAP